MTIIDKRSSTESRNFSSIFISLLLSIFFILSFSSIKYLPGMFVIQEIWYVIVFLFLSTIYAFQISYNKMKISKLEIYGLIILLTMPLIAAYSSNTVFGQPFLFGFLSQRGLILIGCTLIFIFFYRKRKFSLIDVERSFLCLSWTSLFFGLAANLFLDLSQLENKPGFFIQGAGDSQGLLVLDTTFIIFGYFYYAFSSIRSKIVRHFFTSLLFLGYLIFISGGRAGLVALILSYLFFLIRWNSMPRLFVITLQICTGLIFFVSTVAYFPSQKLTILTNRFQDAITVVLTGKESSDFSANARIYETDLALPYISKNILFGNGMLSQKWHNGFENIFGYFHPSDIGLIGVVYVYGIIGFLFFSFQYYFAWKYSRKLPYNSGKHSDLTNALKGFLLYFALVSITTGDFAFSIEKSLLIISVLLCAADYHLRNINMLSDVSNY